MIDILRAGTCILGGRKRLPHPGLSAERVFRVAVLQQLQVRQSVHFSELDLSQRFPFGSRNQNGLVHRLTLCNQAVPGPARGGRVGWGGGLTQPSSGWWGGGERGMSFGRPKHKLNLCLKLCRRVSRESSATGRAGSRSTGCVPVVDLPEPYHGVSCGVGRRILRAEGPRSVCQTPRSALCKLCWILSLRRSVNLNEGRSRSW